MKPLSFYVGRALALSMPALCSTAALWAEPSPASVEKGKQTYMMFCQPCHGPEDTTIDSPSNLFDSKWYHGESRERIEKTVREGIMDKGMPAWGQMISDDEIISVIDYLISFQKQKISSHE